MALALALNILYSNISLLELHKVLLIILGCLVITGHNAYCLVKLYICRVCYFRVLLLYFIYYALLPFCVKKSCS